MEEKMAAAGSVWELERDQGRHVVAFSQERPASQPDWRQLEHAFSNTSIRSEHKYESPRDGSLAADFFCENSMGRLLKGKCH
jgi:hypothetical protein